MRLTLRTLLAYMDDILDPADQEDLARQVEESEKATELIHRTRDATRRLRLGAPPVIGEGMELDPNCVAEYLDNTMSPDDMTEFQQICLDSDVHLAEVASCHHILTMVLGEPAEIDPEMRQRMYTVPARVDEWRQLRMDAPHRVVATGEAAAAPVAASATAEEDEHFTEVPDYLKAGDNSALKRMAFAFAAALVLGFGAFLLFGPDGTLRGGPEVAQEKAADALEDAGAGETATPAEPPAATAPGDSMPPADDLPGVAVPLEDSTEPGNVLPEIAGPADAGAGATPELTAPGEQLSPLAADAEVAEPQLVVPDEVAGEPMPESMANDSSAAESAGSGVASADATGAGEAMAGGPVPEETRVPPPMEAGNPTPPPVDQPERIAMNTPDAMPDAMTETVDAAGEAADDFPLPEAAPLGTMVAPNQVLLRWEPLASQWIRLRSRSSIVAGDQLLSLPTYRPSLALVSGLRVELCGGATMTADYADDGVTPRVTITYGRFLLQNTDMEPVEVELVVSGEARRVILESTAVLGLDVDRPFVPGADVEETTGKFVAKLYAPGGSVTWNTAENPLPIVTAAQWRWDDVTAGSITDDISWMDGQTLDYLLQNVSRNFEQEIDTERPARVQLLELYETSRRREDKALAAQCGTHVGQFVPFVQALADTLQQSNWDSHITELRRAMSRSTQAAKRVHETLIEQRGASVADDLFAMLRGYSPQAIGTTREQVQTGITRQLIDWLQHDRLEYRVLAIHNLKEIYGGKTLGYNPVVTEPSRQERAVKLWRQRLADNELVPEYLE